MQICFQVNTLNICLPQNCVGNSPEIHFTHKHPLTVARSSNDVEPARDDSLPSNVIFGCFRNDRKIEICIRAQTAIWFGLVTCFVFRLG